MLIRVLSIVLILLTMGAPLPVFASDRSEEFARMAATAWAAFQCSTLVDKEEKPGERQELFDFGYQQGKQFLNAFFGGNIDEEHVYRHVPINVLDRIEPYVNPNLPTSEFMLGAIWESASRSVLEAMWESEASPKLFAMSEFSSRNCRSLLAMAKASWNNND